MPSARSTPLIRYNSLVQQITLRWVQFYLSLTFKIFTTGAPDFATHSGTDRQGAQQYSVRRPSLAHEQIEKKWNSEKQLYREALAAYLAAYLPSCQQQ